LRGENAERSLAGECAASAGISASLYSEGRRKPWLSQSKT
jgi:hypothetical protein